MLYIITFHAECMQHSQNYGCPADWSEDFWIDTKFGME